MMKQAYVLFSKLAIRTEIIDFPHIPKGRSAHVRLHEYIVNYFTTISSSSLTTTTTTGNDEEEGEEVLQAEKPNRSCFVNPNTFPLFLQHQGHSRTVVGIETCVDGKVNLLVFDPGL